MAVFDLKNAVIKIKDGTSPTPNSFTIKMGDGNFTADIKNNLEYLKDRGKLDEVRKGEEEPVDISFEGRYVFLKGDTGDDPNLYEVLTKTGNAASWASSASDSCAPYAVDLEVTYTPVCSGIKKEIATYADFRQESINIDYKSGMLSIKGKANVTAPTITRAS